MGLEQYVEKRDFNQTPEPKGTATHPKGALRFVVQRHQASTLHYDFRLEIDGVLKSWAVPKGPSMNPADKRLAMQVEDHPLEYGAFEGEIPEGNYGAGLVQIWDQGYYYAEKAPGREESESLLRQELEKGSLSFVLEGNLLRGGFSLVKMPKKGEDTWLLIKKKDDEATRSPYSSEAFADDVVPGSPGRHDQAEKDKQEALAKINLKPDKKATIAKKAPASKGNKGIVAADIGGLSLNLSNLDKVYWPDEGFTKGDLIHYYRQVARFILPYLKDRPQSLHRHPNGLADEGFYQKDAGSQAPEWVETIQIYSESSKRDVNYILCQNEATLAYLNNLGCIELHPWNSRVDQLDKPDYAVIDLDPGENSYDEVVEVALLVKEIMDQAGATCCCKTSGATGMHVYVPLGRQYEFAKAEAFARKVAERVNAQLPRLTSLERSPKVRRKQIYLDYLQNNIAQTVAAPYSVRPKQGATVSAPLHWEEVKKGLHPSAFTIHTMPQRLNQMGDIFGGVLGLGVNLEECLRKLEK
jgi:bifunctional non-homologous end joining protein LigD